MSCKRSNPSSESPTVSPIPTVVAQATIEDLERQVEADYYNHILHLHLAKKYARRFEEGFPRDNTLNLAMVEFLMSLNIRKTAECLDEFRTFYERHQRMLGITVPFEEYYRNGMLITEDQRVPIDMVVRVRTDLLAMKPRLTNDQCSDALLACAALEREIHEVFQMATWRVSLFESDGTQIIPRHGFYRNWDRAIRSYGFELGRTTLQFGEVHDDGMFDALIQFQTEPLRGRFRSTNGNVILAGLRFITNRLNGQLANVAPIVPAPERKDAVSLAIHELQLVLHDVDNTTPRDRVIKYRVNQLLIMAKDLNDELPPSQVAIARDLSLIVSEVHFLTLIGLFGFEREEGENLFPDSRAIVSWLGQLEDEGLARPKNLEALVRSRELSNPDKFYGKDELGVSDESLVIPSLESIRSRLTSKSWRRVAEKQHIQKNSLRNIEQEIRFRKDEIAVLSEEIDTAPLRLRSQMRALKSLMENVLEVRTKNAEIQRTMLQTLNSLLNEFTEWHQHIGSLPQRRQSIVREEYAKAVEAIERMKTLVSVEEVLSVDSAGELKLFVVGERQVGEFAIAMRAQGVSMLAVASMKPFREIQKTSDLDAAKDWGRRCLGLQSLKALVAKGHLRTD